MRKVFHWFLTKSEVFLNFLQIIEARMDVNCWIAQSDDVILRLRDRKTRCLLRMDHLVVVIQGCRQRLGR